MPEQFIQKPGESKKYTLKSKGYKTLQEAADVGYSPVSAPVTPAVDAVKAATPIKTMPAAFAMPTGYEKISGAKYPTTALQQAAYGDIKTDPTKTFLYGKPTTPITTPATDAMAVAADKDQMPEGYKKISGAEFPTTEAQQAAFEDIKTDPTGEFLYGKPKAVKPEKTTEEKIAEAEPALEREKLGTESPEDIENLAYMREQGWISAKEIIEEKAEEKAVGEQVVETIKTEGLFEAPSVSDVLTQVFSSEEYKMYKEYMETKGMFIEAGGESDKAYLERKYESDKDMLNIRLAAQGLAFSGIRNVSIRGLATELSSSMLDIDREIANKLFELDNDYKNSVYDMVAEVVEKAYKGDKDMIEQLNKAGYAVMPDGTLTPTLEMQKEMRIAEEEAEPEKLQFRTIGNTIVSIDPITGKSTVVFEGEKDKEYDTVVAGGQVWVVDEDFNKIKSLGAAYKATGAGAGVVGPTTKAKDYFSKTQISKGAAEAGMTPSVFGELSVDEANKYVSPKKEPTAAEREIAGDIEVMKGDGNSIADIEAYIKEQGYSPADFSEHYEGYTPEEEGKWWGKSWVGKIPFVK